MNKKYLIGLIVIIFSFLLGVGIERLNNDSVLEHYKLQYNADKQIIQWYEINLKNFYHDMKGTGQKDNEGYVLDYVNWNDNKSNEIIVNKILYLNGKFYYVNNNNKDLTLYMEWARENCTPCFGEGNNISYIEDNKETVMLSKEPSTTSFDYSTKLSLEEQKIVGEWTSQSGETTLVFNADRTGRRIARENETNNNRDYCIEYRSTDNICILDNETNNWRIESGKIITEHSHPYSVQIGNNEVIIGATDSMWSYYMTNETGNDILTLRDFSGVGKDLRFLRVKYIPDVDGEPIQGGNITIYPTNQSLKEHDIVIIIDASGSTAIGKPASSNNLIDANALNIVQNIVGDTNVAVVVFGGAITKTDLLSMSSQANKAELNALISNITPSGGKNPMGLDNGLLAAETLLDSGSGTKEIIVLSDGLIDSEGLVLTKNTVLDLKNKGYTMHFVQVILPPEAKIPNDNYNQLAMAADGQVILLNPDERVGATITAGSTILNIS